MTIMDRPLATAASGCVRQFDTGANRDLATDKLDLAGFLSPKVARRFGAYMNKCRHLPDGSRRAADNWKKGIPLSVYAQSAYRHANELHELLEDAAGPGGIDQLDLVKPEDLLSADEVVCSLLFNLSGYLHERIKTLDNLEIPYPGKRVPGKPPMTYAQAEA